MARFLQSPVPCFKMFQVGISYDFVSTRKACAQAPPCNQKILLQCSIVGLILDWTVSMLRRNTLFISTFLSHEHVGDFWFTAWPTRENININNWQHGARLRDFKSQASQVWSCFLGNILLRSGCDLPILARLARRCPVPGLKRHYNGAPLCLRSSRSRQGDAFLLAKSHHIRLKSFLLELRYDVALCMSPSPSSASRFTVPM